MSHSRSCGNCGEQTYREPLCEPCNKDDLNNASGAEFCAAHDATVAERNAVLAEIRRLRDRWGPRHTALSVRVCGVLSELETTIRQGKHVP